MNQSSISEFDDRRLLVSIFCTIMVVALFFVGARFYAKIHILHEVTWDDG